MAKSYKLFGDGNYIDSTGIAHNKVPLNEVLDNLNITAYYRKYENVYTTVAEVESIIPIGIPDMNEASILFVDINGIDKAEGVDYTIDYTNKTITLTEALDAVGQEVHFIVLRTMAATSENYDLLKGADGNGVIPGGAEGQVLIKTSDADYDTKWGDVSSVTIKRWEANA